MSIMYSGGKVEKYTQGQYVFAIRQFTPFHAMYVLGELQKVIAPAIGGAFQGLKEDSLDKDVRDMLFLGETLSNAFNNLAKNADGKQLEQAASLLLDPDYVSVAPKMNKGAPEFQVLDEAAINEVFSGRIIDMFVLMIKVFRVNYMDFSKLSSVPTGVRKTLAEVKQSFLGNTLLSSDK